MTMKLVFALALLMSVCVTTIPVSAHAELLSAEPAPGSAHSAAPGRIELRYSEPVLPELSSVSVLDSDGMPVPLAPLAVDPADAHLARVALSDPTALKPGVYTVVWGAYSAEDGHASSGSYTFSVGTGEAPAQAAGKNGVAATWSIAGKWFELIGLILLSGLALFGVTNGASVREQVAGRRRVFVALILLALSGASISLRARENSIDGSALLGRIDFGTMGELLGSAFGRAWLVRMALLLSALGALWFAERLAARTLLMIWIGCGLAGLATIAISGHAGSVDSRGLATLVDLVHMSAAAFWLGGLLGLLLVLPPGVAGSEDRWLLRRQGNRFLGAVALIVAAGVVSAFWHVGGRRSLLTTDYGRTLLVKVGIVAAIIGLAWYNRRVLQSDPGRPRWVPLAIGAELVLATVVLLFSADLSQTPPANQPLTVPVAARALDLAVEGHAGVTSVTATGVLTGDPTDQIELNVAPTGAIQRVIVRLSLVEAESGVSVGDRFDAAPVEGRPGVFRFSAGRLGIAGPWQLEITVRRAGVQDEIVSIPVDTSQLKHAGTRTTADIWRGFRLTTHTVLALTLAVVVLVIGIGGLRRITGLEPLASGFLLAASMVIAAGLLVSATRGLIPVTPDHALTKPAAASTGAITAATTLYQSNCLSCHGPDGAGAGTSNPAHLHGSAGDLTGKRTVLQSDGDLFWWLTNGVGGTRMPAFDPALTEDERWQLILYLRQLQQDASEENASE